MAGIRGTSVDSARPHDLVIPYLVALLSSFAPSHPAQLVPAEKPPHVPPSATAPATSQLEAQSTAVRVILADKGFGLGALGAAIAARPGPVQVREGYGFQSHAKSPKHWGARTSHSGTAGARAGWVRAGCIMWPSQDAVPMYAEHSYGNTTM